MNGQSENSDLSKKFENYTYPVDDSNWEAIAAGIPYGNGDGFLAGKFATHFVRPSSHVWSRIDAALRPSSGRRVVAWWWYAAAASVLLFAVFTFVKYNTAQDQLPIAEQKVKAENKTGGIESSDSTKTNSNAFGSDTSRTQSNPAFAKAEPTTNSKIDSQTDSKTNPNTEYKTENEKQLTGADFKPDENSIRSQNANAVADLRTNREGAIPQNQTVKTNQETPKNADFDEIISTQYIKKISTQIQVQLTQGTLADQLREVEFADSESTGKKAKSSPFYDGTEKQTTNEFSVLAGSQLAFAGNGGQDEANFDYASNSGGGIGSINPNESYDSYETASYSTPIYFGVNGEIEFLKRFSAGLGLGYLRMQKTLDYYSGSPQNVATETENRYLSIPIYLKFNFIYKPKFSAYTTLGNAYDVQIWQKINSETFVNGQLTQTDTSNKNENGNQANIYTGLGMTFKFTKHFGLYAEGSLMRYYYSSNTNFFSQQNLWPGLRFGAVVSF